MFGRSPFIEAFIPFILSNISSLSNTENPAPLDFIMSPGFFFLFLNVSRKTFTNIPTSFLSLPIPPCSQCPTYKKLKDSSTTFISSSNSSEYEVTFLKIFVSVPSNKTSIGFSDFNSPVFSFVLSSVISKPTVLITSFTKLDGTIFISILFIPSSQLGGHTVISNPAVIPILYLPIVENSFGITI